MTDKEKAAAMERQAVEDMAKADAEIRAMTPAAQAEHALAQEHLAQKIQSADAFIERAPDDREIKKQPAS